MLAQLRSTATNFVVMKQKERRVTNEMEFQSVLLTVFDVLRPTQSFPCSGCPLLTITLSACLPTRQGPSPRNPSGAQHVPRHSRTRQPAIQLCEISSVSVLRRLWSTVDSWYAVASEGPAALSWWASCVMLGLAASYRRWDSHWREGRYSKAGAFSS
jgi:hypothetical protein